MNEVFGKEGCLKDILPFYEHRESQEKMAESIYHAMEKKSSLIVEAATGVGKTLAYLVPALKHALAENKVLAISTETKSLQKQIIDKDIPLIKKIFSEQWGLNFRSSLCLGSANYPCRKRLEIMIHKGRDVKDYSHEMEELLDAFNNSSGGTEVISRYDFDFSSRFWSKVQRDSDICNFRKCQFSTVCAFHQIRNQWRSSNLLVMNHYLFFSNLAIGKSYLPHFDYIIFDEAHSVDAIASRQMGFNIAKNSTKSLINDFYNNKDKGIIFNIIEDKKLNQAMTACESLSKKFDIFFDSVESLLEGSKKVQSRIVEPLAIGNELSKASSDFLNIMDNCEEYFQEEELEAQFDYLRAKLFTFIQNLNMVVYDAEPDWVYWVDNSQTGHGANVRISGTPISVGNILTEDLYPYYESVIYTSATISVGGDFSYYKKSLSADFMKTLLLESPFDYKGNAMLYLPVDLPAPQEYTYIEKSVDRAIEIIHRVGGNCLLLFTSYDMLHQFKDKLETEMDCNIYSQGEYEAVQAIRLYKSNPGSVLMGTHSFWQGLDLPGDLLKAVIMMRLPFGVPGRPDLEARLEKIKEEGGNPFMDYQVPEAIIKFRQGFGRLIRKEDDYGIVAIFDKRVINKGYGKYFIQSIPECGRAKNLKDMETFIENKQLNQGK